MSKIKLKEDFSPDLDAFQEKVQIARITIKEEYLAQNNEPWVIAYSGGKDSSLLMHLVFEQILSIPKEKRIRDIYIVSNDTLVESPLVAKHLHSSLEEIRKFVAKSDLPVSIKVTTPKYYDSFWVNLIGRGYPTPNRMFRWCTDRLKIDPTSEYIKKQISRNGKVIMLLGTRTTESSVRAHSIRKHKRKDSHYSNHSELPNCKIFSPIVDFLDDEVWMFLMQNKPFWGGSYRQLITLYRNAKGGECPTVLSKVEAPSCGTTSPRFGCWVCTVVQKDKSLEGLIDSGFLEYEALADFRDWLISIRDQSRYRLPVNRRGEVRTRDDGSIMPGAFTLEARELILSELLKLQDEVSMPLISDNEIEEIKSLWNTDRLLLEYLGIDELEVKCIGSGN